MNAKFQNFESRRKLSNYSACIITAVTQGDGEGALRPKNANPPALDTPGAGVTPRLNKSIVLAAVRHTSSAQGMSEGTGERRDALSRHGCCGIQRAF